MGEVCAYRVLCDVAERIGQCIAMNAGRDCGDVGCARCQRVEHLSLAIPAVRDVRIDRRVGILE
jgi:hypothetical protein